MVNTALGNIFTKEHVEELSGISTIADMVTYLNSIVDAPVSEETTVSAAENMVTPSSVSNDQISKILLEAIADKTGYPEDMIDDDMELEADLGIDSIKRVEILADVLKRLNITLTLDQTEELSAMSTVEAITDYLSTLV